MIITEKASHLRKMKKNKEKIPWPPPPFLNNMPSTFKPTPSWCLRIVYSDKTSSFEGLLKIDRYVPINIWNLLMLATKMFQIHINEAPPIFSNLFKSHDKTYNLRKLLIFKNLNVRTVFNGIESISFLGPKM